MFVCDVVTPDRTITGNGLSNVVLTPSQVLKLQTLGRNFEADFTVSKCPDGSGFNPTTNPLSSAVGGVRVCVVGESSPVVTAPPNASDDGGLSTGALVGIVAGAVVAVALVALLVLRNRRKGADYGHPPDTSKGPYYNTHNPTGSYPYNSGGGDTLGILDDPELLAVRINAAEVTEIQMISRGGFGEVWSGIYQNNPVAIKKLLPDKKNFDDAMAFAAEIKLMARLQHPKIVTFIGASWSNAVNIQAISEYMNCGDLKSLLDRSAKSGQELPWLSVKLNLAVDVSDALVYLHTLNPVFVHRDLKSRNILIDADTGAKLSDFGISRNRAADETMTAGVGTCRWMAPEVIRGEKYDAACDVWSFGCVLAEMDTGASGYQCNVPYNDSTNTNGGRLQDHGIMELVSKNQLKPTFSASMPPEILAVAQQCLEFDPAQRPKATVVSYALRKFRKAVEKSSQSGYSNQNSTM
ncbi:hypothetical protein DYB35_003119 [Aphanomyces astaci]|uniref:Protein kinase domain-containing protein n=1 Tax=Aphanomyces astaci TaxID=112090 RepID=A0A418CS59_APHAT|nr:hypothetical protein DYB35_003119 [Aphanomyces astaci]